MCAEVECQRHAVARGLCLMHYKRARRRGEFTTTRQYGAGLDFLRSIPETDECVEYPFGKFSTGYGNVKVNGRSRTAHSVAYELHVGSIPEGYDVCHNCGHRPCVNPQHLRADTHVSNMADKLAHGTHHRGVRNGRARLTESEVISIRESVAAGAVQKDVARQMGVSPQTVNHIVQGRTWNAEVVPSGAASSF